MSEFVDMHGNVYTLEAVRKFAEKELRRLSDEDFLDRLQEAAEAPIQTVHVESEKREYLPPREPCTSPKGHQLVGPLRAEMYRTVAYCGECGLDYRIAFVEANGERLVECQECRGTGYDPHYRTTYGVYDQPEPCPDCQGHGVIPDWLEEKRLYQLMEQARRVVASAFEPDLF